MYRISIPIVLALAACTGGPYADDGGGSPQASETPAPEPTPGAAVDTLTNAATVREMCGLAGDAMITGDGVGAFTVGASAADLLAGCPAAADTTIRDVEGMTQRTIRLGLDGGAVSAMIVDDAVWRVHVTDRTLETPTGVAVGTTIAELLQREGARGMMGEGRIYVTLQDHCGMSFRLDAAPDDVARAGDWTSDRLAELPDSTPVDEILAFGCEAGAA